MQHPLTKDLSDAEIKDIVPNRQEILRYACPNQEVKRHVQNLTETAVIVSGDTVTSHCDTVTMCDSVTMRWTNAQQSKIIC